MCYLPRTHEGPEHYPPTILHPLVMAMVKERHPGTVECTFHQTLDANLLLSPHLRRIAGVCPKLPHCGWISLKGHSYGGVENMSISYLLITKGVLLRGGYGQRNLNSSTVWFVYYPERTWWMMFDVD